MYNPSVGVEFPQSFRVLQRVKAHRPFVHGPSSADQNWSNRSSQGHQFSPAQHCEALTISEGVHRRKTSFPQRANLVRLVSDTVCVAQTALASAGPGRAGVAVVRAITADG